LGLRRIARHHDGCPIVRHPTKEIDLKTGLQSITNYNISVAALPHIHNGLHYSFSLSGA